MPLTERHFYITGDGKSYPLDTASSARVVLTDEGTGMPPLEYITERGPFQHGETVKAYFLRPRTIQFLIRQNACSREEYWRVRAALIDALRPNRGPGVIRKILANGRKFDIGVRIIEGPRFEPRDITAWDEWSIQEVLRFIAYDPVYYDPALKTVCFVPPSTTGFTYTFPFEFSEEAQLVLPFTLPFQFSEFIVELSIDYPGTWIEYPIFKLDGRATGVIIENITTGHTIDLHGVMIPAGMYLTIDLSFGVKTAFLSDGTNVMNYVAGYSDFSEFHIQPGVNHLRARVVYSDTNTKLCMSYYERYIGI